MSELLIMLMPLYTLPGWPTAPDPSVLQTLGLLIGLPLLVMVIVAAIAKIGTVVQAGRGNGIEVTEPVWVGGRQSQAVEGSSGATAIGSGAATGGSEGNSGGASARW